MKRLFVMIATLFVLCSTGWSVILEATVDHTIAQGDSANSNKLYYKDTALSVSIDIREFSRLWFQFQKHAPAAGTDSNFQYDSVEVYVQTSMDGTNWTTTALCTAPRVPLFATADTFFNVTTTPGKAMKRDSTIVACGPLMRAMFVIVDTSGWSAGIKGRTYAKKFQLHVEGIKP